MSFSNQELIGFVTSLSNLGLILVQAIIAFIAYCEIVSMGVNIIINVRIVRRPEINNICQRFISLCAI